MNMNQNILIASIVIAVVGFNFSFAHADSLKVCKVQIVGGGQRSGILADPPRYDNDPTTEREHNGRTYKRKLSNSVRELSALRFVITLGIPESVRVSAGREFIFKEKWGTPCRELTADEMKDYLKTKCKGRKILEDLYCGVSKFNNQPYVEFTGEENRGAFYTSEEFIANLLNGKLCKEVKGMHFGRDDDKGTIPL